MRNIIEKGISFMYVPNVGLFFEKNGKGKDVEELLNAETPKQEEIFLEEQDIAGQGEFVPNPELALVFRFARNGGWNAVFAVTEGRKTLAACPVEVTSHISKHAIRAVKAGVAKRKGFVKLPVILLENPKITFSDDRSMCIREFAVSSMGVIINGVVYREWWDIDSEENRATLSRAEIGKEFSSQKWENLKKQSCLLLD